MADHFDPNDATQYEDVAPILAVIDAWTAPWADPAWEVECRHEVEKLMPALARSLDRLASQARIRNVQTGMEPENMEREEVEPQAAEPIVEPIAEPQNDVMSYDGNDEDGEPDYITATIEEIGARGLRATQRLQAWGRRRIYWARAARESEIRERIVVFLNNRDGVTQHDIGTMLGISTGRVTQIVGNYYNRLEYEYESAKKGK